MTENGSKQLFLAVFDGLNRLMAHQNAKNQVMHHKKCIKSLMIKM